MTRIEKLRAGWLEVGRSIRYPLNVKYAKAAVALWAFAAAANIYAAINGIINGGYLTLLSIVAAILTTWAFVASIRGVGHARVKEAEWEQLKAEWDRIEIEIKKEYGNDA